MLATFAFDVCHDVYRAAREVIDMKIATLNMESSGKYMWHPDRLPRLAEYVADFARAGERALGETGRPARRNLPIRCVPSHLRASAQNGQNGAHILLEGGRARSAQGVLAASRMAMFRVFFLGGAEYQAARRHLGISELTWADWSEEIRTRVGQELSRSGVFPPSKYFRESSNAA